MLDKAILAFLLGFGVMISAAPVAAFHGAPYQATGLACPAGAAPCLKVDLQWGGSIGAGGMAQLVIYDPALNLLAARVSVPAIESFGGLQFGAAVNCNIAEHTTSYSLRDANAASKVLLLTGGMELCFDGPNGGRRFCDLEGQFLQVFAVTLGCDRPA